MGNLITTLTFLSTLFLLNACGGGSNKTSTPKAQPRGNLISAKHLATKQNIFFPYQVSAYKIVYSTVDTKNNTINASGLLTIPQKNSGEKSPLLSYQHGTIFLNTQAPSISATSINGIMALSGTGYIVSAPDYIGYGESENKLHPYIHADSLASASIDMLRASKDFLVQQNIPINSQLFLAGYSEGGYATLALQKELQESHSDEFNISASAAGAGPFDLTETMKVLANRVTNKNPSYMSFVLKAYDNIYQLNKLSEMFQTPFINTVNSSFDGHHSGASIDKKLSHSTSELFKPTFLNAMQGSDQHIIKNKLALNNIYDWKPNAPTRFYHSPSDEIVPYSNAQKVLSTMQANGATNIDLVDCGFATHVACAFPYVLNTLNFFSVYANDL